MQQIVITPREFSEQQKANTDSPKTFLINRRDALYGIPMLAVNEFRLQDYDDRTLWIKNGLVAFDSDRPIDTHDTTRRRQI